MQGMDTIALNGHVYINNVCDGVYLLFFFTADSSPGTNLRVSLALDGVE